MLGLKVFELSYVNLMLRLKVFELPHYSQALVKHPVFILAMVRSIHNVSVCLQSVDGTNT